MSGEYARKFIVTDDDKRYAADLVKKIDRAQCQMKELLEESYQSGAYIAAGFTAWPAFAASVLDATHYRIYDIGRSMGASPGGIRVAGETALAREVLGYIHEHPGCTFEEARAAFGADRRAIITQLRDRGLVRFDKSNKRVTLWPTEAGDGS